MSKKNKENRNNNNNNNQNEERQNEHTRGRYVCCSKYRFQINKNQIVNYLIPFFYSSNWSIFFFEFYMIARVANNLNNEYEKKKREEETQEQDKPSK